MIAVVGCYASIFGLYKLSSAFSAKKPVPAAPISAAPAISTGAASKWGFEPPTLETFDEWGANEENWKKWEEFSARRRLPGVHPWADARDDASPVKIAPLMLTRDLCRAPLLPQCRARFSTNGRSRSTNCLSFGDSRVCCRSRACAVIICAIIIAVRKCEPVRAAPPPNASFRVPRNTRNSGDGIELPRAPHLCHTELGNERVRKNSESVEHFEC